jgi:NADH-quinone oxidoreductase subunit J
MVFMVYVIMLLDVRDPSFVRRYSHVLVPGVIAGMLLVAALGFAAMRPGNVVAAAAQPGVSYLIQPFSAAFLRTYWLHFELTSVLLVAAVVAAIAVIKGGRRHDG